MQRKIKPVKLQENYYGTLYPAPGIRSVNAPSLNGGLNLWDLPYNLPVNQSPDMLNVSWEDGALASRKGQEYLKSPLTGSITTSIVDAEVSIDWAVYSRKRVSMTFDTDSSVNYGNQVFTYFTRTGEPGGWRLNGIDSDQELSWYGISLILPEGRELEYPDTITVNIPSNAITNSYDCEAYERLWNGMIIARLGSNVSGSPGGSRIVAIDPDDASNITTLISLNDAPDYIIGRVPGSFFVFDDNLYYMGGGDYIKIDDELNAAPVDPYVPTVVVNCAPNGVGGGVFEDENRLTAKKTVQFTTTGTDTAYMVPPVYTPIDDEEVVIKQTSPTVIDYKEIVDATGISFPAPGWSWAYYYDGVSYYKTWSTPLTKYGASARTSRAGLTATVNGSTLATQTRNSGTYSCRFYVTDLNPAGYWSPSLATYGLTVSGTPQAGDRVYADLQWYNAVLGPDLDETYTLDRATGEITFHSAPAAYVVYPSNLSVTLSKANPEAKSAVLNSKYTKVFGSDNWLTVVCGGTAVQPNAYFWSGHTNLGADPTYFPFDYFNYAGADDEDAITGFAEQQSMLVIFKAHSIGKTYLSSVTVNDMDYIKLPYTPVNDIVGCDVPKSIRFVQNNTVFANTYGGVYVLLDSSAYGENNVKRLSRNINGDGGFSPKYSLKIYDAPGDLPSAGEPDVYYQLNSYYHPRDEIITAPVVVSWSEEIHGYEMGAPLSGLLYDLNNARSNVSSYDDGRRYWLCINGHVYLWDYLLSSYRSSEENVSWFYYDNIRAQVWIKDGLSSYYISKEAYPLWGLVKLTDGYNDFGGGYTRKYTFAVQHFGRYDVLKDVMKVVFSVRTDTNPFIDIYYHTDYELRKDLTPITAFAWRLVPRNLMMRCLRPVPFATVAVRIPRCFHIRHFSMTLENKRPDADMSVVGAQIFYRYSKEER